MSALPRRNGRSWSVHPAANGRKQSFANDRRSEAAVKNIVPVHGGFVDGSGWAQVYHGLRKDGYNVTAVQNPTTITLADDVATTKLMIAQQSGPVVLVSHSYGGAVITEAGTDPKVKGLVYIAAFAPDKGESVQTVENPDRTTR
jgi:pimeloyl-ACP methyl ester carboxylesterase